MFVMPRGRLIKDHLSDISPKYDNWPIVEQYTLRTSYLGSLMTKNMISAVLF